MRIKILINKICPCGKAFYIKPSLLKRKKFCSLKCKYKYCKRSSGLIYKKHKENPTSFKKGQKPWNAGLKGSQTPWNKGIKGTHFSEVTEFKKGNIPWNDNKIIWTGTPKEYNRIHYQVRKLFGKPLKCEHCGRGKRFVWGNKSQRYLLKREDWIQLCRGCHTKYDFNYIKKNYGK